MDVVESLSSNGVPTMTEAGTPSPLPEERTADGLEAIELESVLEVVAGHAAGLLGAARVRGRRPTLDLDWVRQELARVGEVAALFRRGDGLLAEPVPDVSRALSRLRIEGSVLEGGDLVAIQRLLGAARRVHDDLRRAKEAAPLAAELSHELPDKSCERRLEQSLDPDGTLLDTASPGLATTTASATTRNDHAGRPEPVIRRARGRGPVSGVAVTVTRSRLRRAGGRPRR